jgi:hypothetical protein
MRVCKEIYSKNCNIPSNFKTVILQNNTTLFMGFFFFFFHFFIFFTTNQHQNISNFSLFISHQ